MLSSTLKNKQGQQGPEGRRGQAGEDGQGMDEAFVEDPQHDVDDQNGQDQQEPQALSWRIERPGPFPGNWW